MASSQVMTFAPRGIRSSSSFVKNPRVSWKKPRVNSSNFSMSSEIFDVSGSSSAAVDAPKRIASP